jgi:RNase P subunit RPR2
MKKLYCEKCRKQIGEMSKGRIIKNTILICPYCQEIDRLNESADRFKNIGGDGSDIWHDMIKGFKK